MIQQMHNSVQRARGWVVLALALAVAMATPSTAFGSDPQKKNAAPSAPKSEGVLSDLDKSRIVWPQPPYIARIKYIDFFAGEKLPDFAAKPAKTKNAWMDRLAGSAGNKGEDTLKNHFFMGEPHGMAVDSKGNLYVADSKVGAIFIINPETHDTVMIKNGKDASFGLIMGLAIDDSDRLFVADSEAHRVLVFGANHKAESAIREGLASPTGLAIDNENRFLYISDIAADQVLVYDADTLQLLRKIGTGGKTHTLTTPGDFAKPTGVAVDSDGNLYVVDMLNARIEIFDADGNFIRTFGKRGDGPGYFAMPKGVAIDSDGHIWVSDSMQNRLQVYSQEGELLIYMGIAQGLLPGQFSGLQYIAADTKRHIIFTSEVFPGRVQEFRYVTQDEAVVEEKRREAEKKDGKPANKAAAKPAAPSQGVASKP